MARLTSFDPAEARVLRIGEYRYRVRSNPHGQPTLRLQNLSAGGEDLEISRAELAAAVVLEDAAFEDEIEDPDPNVRAVTNLSFLPISRLWDWFAKIFLLRRMHRYSGVSPQSKIFRLAHEQALAELEAWQQACGVLDAKRWTAWTCYQELLRWRRSGHQLGAIHRKGLEYSPWTKRENTRDAAREIAAEIKYANPHLTVAQVHRMTVARLNQIGTQNEAEGAEVNLA